MNDSSVGPSAANDLQEARPRTLTYLLDNARTPKSIRINIFGGTHKVCSFNCSYCEFGATEVRLNQVKTIDGLPSPEEIVNQVSDAYSAAKGEGFEIERWTVMPAGEPTLHPKFAELTSQLIDLRDRIAPEIKLGLSVNGTYLDQRKVYSVVEKYDEHYCKIDVGNERLLKAFNRPLVRISTERILESYRRFENVIVASLFSGGALTNCRPEHLEEWMEILALIEPQKVVLSTPRRTHLSDELETLSEDDLQIIAAKLRMKIGIVAQTCYD